MPLFCHVVIVITAEYRDYGDHCSVGEYSGRHMAVILMDHTALKISVKLGIGGY